MFGVKSKYKKIFKKEPGLEKKKPEPDLIGIGNLFFDEEFYLENYQDIKEAGVDPYAHYLGYGWKEHRDPSPFFNTKFYLLSNQDVLEAGINPLIHYVGWGKKEGRKIQSSILIKTSISVASGDVFEEYQNMCSIALGAKSPNYAPRMKVKLHEDQGQPKFIAYYLPQFHPFSENDEWWGKGFTEWTNVSKAVPQFKGHYQPRLPGELGFYDLRNKDILPQQISLAKDYGISGFCFHYYWFDGKRLMEKPIENFLNDKREESNFPFSLCWANENWTRRWDGSENDVLIAQNHTEEDNELAFYDLLRYFKDERYITVDGKPFVIIYRPEVIPNVEVLVKQWRDLAVKEGLPGLHLVATNAFGFNSPEEIGFDAIVEFPPHSVSARQINHQLNILNPNYEGNVYDYGETVDYCLERFETISASEKGEGYYPCVMTGWDNEARKPGKGNTFHNATPEKFREWLSGAEKFSRCNHCDDSKFVFVNAWNEWAEGTYLEPDRYMGYSYLNAVSSVRNNYVDEHELEAIVSLLNDKPKKSKTAILLHLFYEDLVEEFSDAFDKLKFDFDVILTIPNSFDADSLRFAIEKINPTRVLVLDNTGRDIYPFIEALKLINEMEYELVCKIHSKKSAHITGGEKWRKSILDGLFSPLSVEQVFKEFSSNSEVGLMAPSESIYPLDLKNESMINNTQVFNQLVEDLGVNGSLDGSEFVAGTMFWFKPAAVSSLSDVLDKHDFGHELGAIDGTLAHSVERVVGVVVNASGYKVLGYSTDDFYDPYKV